MELASEEGVIYAHELVRAAGGGQQRHQDTRALQVERSTGPISSCWSYRTIGLAGRPLIMDKRGFTIIEMTVVVFILTTAIRGMGASATFMIQASGTAGLKSEALQSVRGADLTAS